jgi:hypothetical protein
MTEVNKIDRERLANLLDKLQSPKNQGRGVSCVQTLITYLRTGNYDWAKNVASNENDKIRSYGDIKLVLDYEFGLPVGNDSSVMAKCKECGKLMIASKWLDSNATHYYCNHCSAKEAIKIPKDQFEKEFWEFIESEETRED